VPVGWKPSADSDEMVVLCGYRNHRRGVTPDVRVQPTIADILKGREPGMAMALALTSREEIA
jgi:hypothetical protein